MTFGWRLVLLNLNQSSRSNSEIRYYYYSKMPNKKLHLWLKYFHWEEIRSFSTQKEPSFFFWFLLSTFQNILFLPNSSRTFQHLLICSFVLFYIFYFLLELLKLLLFSHTFSNFSEIFSFRFFSLFLSHNIPQISP